MSSRAALVPVSLNFLALGEGALARRASVFEEGLSKARDEEGKSQITSRCDGFGVTSFPLFFVGLSDVQGSKPTEDK